jgi:radical SAM-linked protein
VADAVGRLGSPGTATATRVRGRYAKRDKIRFVSAIDLGRLWERALRRADLPIAYSEGFSPHPKVSFPDALPLGYASTGEYVELTFAAPIALQTGMQALNAAFPTGLEVLDAHAVADGAPKLAKGLRASLWTMDYRLGPSAPADAAALTDAVEAVRAAAALLVERQRKGAPVQVDLRPAIHQISLLHPHPDTPPCEGDLVRVAVVLHHLEPPVRPSEVHLALTDHHTSTTADTLSQPALVTRVAQGEAIDEGVAEALTGARIAPSPPPASP